MPRLVRDIPAITSAAAGLDHSLFLDSVGSEVYASGSNESKKYLVLIVVDYQLGIGASGQSTNRPVKIDATNIGDKPFQIYAGRHHSIVTADKCVFNIF